MFTTLCKEYNESTQIFSRPSRPGNVCFHDFYGQHWEHMWIFSLLTIVSTQRLGPAGVRSFPQPS